MPKIRLTTLSTATGTKFCTRILKVLPRKARLLDLTRPQIAMNILLMMFSMLLCATADEITEDERVRLWHERNTWPPQWQPESDVYSTAMEAREQEIMSLTGADERWENWMQFVQGRMLPKFTENGFAVIKTPPHVHAKLKKAVDDAVANWELISEEQEVQGSIYGTHIPKFVNIVDLSDEVMGDLKSLHEGWGGMELEGTSAYGVRLYRDGASLAMHNDRVRTHVISSIVHIAHEYDNEDEPWPIEIEDHDGNLHAVNLQMGEMLFYESAKCLHGRRSQLKGKYYGSIFVHYQPVDRSIWNYTIEDVIANVPPHWNEGILEDHGSRWVGQGITVDRRVAAGAPPRSYNNTEPAFYYSEGTTDDYVDEGVDADVEEGEGGEDEQDL